MELGRVNGGKELGREAWWNALACLGFTHIVVCLAVANEQDLESGRHLVLSKSPRTRVATSKPDRCTPMERESDSRSQNMVCRSCLRVDQAESRAFVVAAARMRQKTNA
jgi:hypothetical protein